MHQRRATVRADMTTVQVGDEVHGVVGELGRSSFESILRSCDASSPSILAFTGWRHSRLAANFTAGVGIVVLPVGMDTAIMASKAGEQRLEFIDSLQRDLDGSDRQ